MYLCMKGCGGLGLRAIIVHIQLDLTVRPWVDCLCKAWENRIFPILRITNSQRRCHKCQKGLMPHGIQFSGLCRSVFMRTQTWLPFRPMHWFSLKWTLAWQHHLMCSIALLYLCICLMPYYLSVSLINQHVFLTHFSSLGFMHHDQHWTHKYDATWWVIIDQESITTKLSLPSQKRDNFRRELHGWLVLFAIQKSYRWWWWWWWWWIHK